MALPPQLSGLPETPKCCGTLAGKSPQCQAAKASVPSRAASETASKLQSSTVLRALTGPGIDPASIPPGEVCLSSGGQGRGGRCNGSKFVGVRGYEDPRDL